VNAHVAIERALALLELGRPAEALDHLRGAVAEEPEMPEAHSLIALARLQLGDPQGALEAAGTAVASGPEEEWGHRLRAIALIELGRRREAREAALEAARLAPSEATSYIVLAGALQADGDEAGAEQAARHAIELDPENADAHSTLGEVLLEHDRPAEAVRAYEASLALDPENADALNNLAVARLRAADRAGTETQFETAAMLDPRLDVVRHNILHTGRAGRSYVYRRFTTTLAISALLLAPAALGVSIFFLVLAAGLEAMRAADVRGLSEATQTLIRDDRSARRLKPHRWDWGWPTRLRPWWWIVLSRQPPPLLLGLNVAFLLLAIAAGLAIWILALTIALPFSALRTWRWYRRRHPGAGSWRPPA
jgi:tetratricopeptide (TPR) repeat protein